MTASEFLRRLAEVLSRDPGSGEAGTETVAASAEPEAPGAAVDTSCTPRAEEAAESERPDDDAGSSVPEGDDDSYSSLREPPRDEGAGMNVVTGERMPEMPEGGFWTPMGGPWIRR